MQDNYSCENFYGIIEIKNSLRPAQRQTKVVVKIVERTQL